MTKRQFASWRVQALVAALIVALGVAVALLPAVSSLAQTMKPPEIYKTADVSEVWLNAPARFGIPVINPSPPEGDPWIDLVVTDVVDPALQIDEVAVSPPADEVIIVGNTVQVVVYSLAPGETFVITIDCTLVGPAQPGDVLVNEATLEYSWPDGTPADPVTSDPVEIQVVVRYLMPLIFSKRKRS